MGEEERSEGQQVIAEARVLGVAVVLCLVRQVQWPVDIQLFVRISIHQIISRRTFYNLACQLSRINQFPIPKTTGECGTTRQVNGTIHHHWTHNHKYKSIKPEFWGIPSWWSRLRNVRTRLTRLFGWGG